MEAAGWKNMVSVVFFILKTGKTVLIIMTPLLVMSYNDFVKKKASARKLKFIALAEYSLGSLSSLNIAWNHDEKINKVGILSGSFWFRD